MQDESDELDSIIDSLSEGIAFDREQAQVVVPAQQPITDAERGLVKKVIERLKVTQPKKHEVSEQFTRRQCAVHLMEWLQKINQLTLVGIVCIFLALFPWDVLSFAGAGGGMAFFMWNYIKAKQSADALKLKYGI